MALAVYCMQRNEKVWDNPSTFDPKRFLSPSLIKENSFIPFSLGVRSCVGKRFAMIEGTLMIAFICLHYKLFPKKCNLDKLTTIITLQPVTPIELTVERR